jgi:hemoglobin
MNTHCKYLFENPMMAPSGDDDRMQRRQAYADGVAADTGIDEALIHSLVHAFYDRVRNDDILAPIFAARVADWEPHLEKMCAFWSSVMLMTGRYHGRPMPAHATLPVDGAHFARWLALFEATARDIASPAAADRFVERAHMIAGNLWRAVEIHQGRAPPPIATLAGRAP